MDNNEKNGVFFRMGDGQFYDFNIENEDVKLRNWLMMDDKLIVDRLNLKCQWNGQRGGSSVGGGFLKDMIFS